MKKGFSFVEVITIVAILGILAVVTIPSYTRWAQSYYLKEEAQRLNDAIKKTQSMVVTGQKGYYIEFAPDKEEYYIKDANDIMKEGFKLRSDITFLQINITDYKIHFTNLGIPDHPGTIVLENRIGQTKTIEVTPSGFVKIY